ncbi:hypothetical protein CYMTET_45213 [Cymbomonas tetramitiformis]|uniref:F-box/LRR-repeat protein 15-like leucin rich repeat domain-containing protein n=1 Tax=Cymbomonas tetramitiformis TaxID=36881 RepID=A0AAE0BZY9_9CHLO|nr:hypothetical protein CYMTET_45213 [Cymbomonas tetramitiformis]
MNTMVPAGISEMARNGGLPEVYISDGSLYFMCPLQPDRSEEGYVTISDVGEEDFPKASEHDVSVPEQTPSQCAGIDCPGGRDSVVQIAHPSSVVALTSPQTCSTLLGLPRELGARVLQRLNIQRTLSLRSLSQETCAWVDGCLPYFTRLSWGSRAACTQPEHLLHSLLDKYGMYNLHAIDWCFSSQMYRDSTLSRLAPACANLVELSLNQSENVDDTFITEFARNCLRLQVLNVNSCTSVTSKSIESVALHCPELSRLDVGRCLRVDTNSIVLFVEKCTGLQHLNVSFCNIADAALFAVVQHSRKLRYLNITACKQVTDEGLLAVGKRCPQLQHLLCGSNRKLTDASIRALAWCRSLRSLSIEASNANDISLFMIGKHCTALQALNISSCLNVTDTGICQFFALQNRTLKQVNLSFCQNVLDSTILHLTEFCPQLKELLVSGCTAVTDSSLFAVAERCAQLQTLEVFACQLVSDQSICSIVQMCPNLSKVTLSHCPLVTDLSVVALASYCSKLIHVDLEGCPNVTSDAIQLLVDSCSSLKSWSVSQSARNEGTVKQRAKIKKRREPGVRPRGYSL